MNSFRNQYPDFAAVEAYVVQARAERAVAIAGMVAGAIDAAVKGARALYARIGAGTPSERDRRAIESDSFLKRSVPRY